MKAILTTLSIIWLLTACTTAAVISGAEGDNTLSDGNGTDMLENKQ